MSEFRLFWESAERSGIASEIHLSDGFSASYPDAQAVNEWTESYEAWKALVSQARPLGHETVVTTADPLNWSPLGKPLSESTVALVSTGGVHLTTQEPFDIFAEEGDWTARAIPGDVATEDLSVSHTHYATDDALQDVNVMFPLDRLRELADEGVVGAVSPLHFGLMGFIPDPSMLVSETVPKIGQELLQHGVDAVVLSPG